MTFLMACLSMFSRRWSLHRWNTSSSMYPMLINIVYRLYPRWWVPHIDVGQETLPLPLFKACLKLKVIVICLIDLVFVPLAERLVKHVFKKMNIIMYMYIVTAGCHFTNRLQWDQNFEKNILAITDYRLIVKIL